MRLPPLYRLRTYSMALLLTAALLWVVVDGLRQWWG